MSLKERLLNDMKTAMKEKDIISKNTIQMARSAILQVEKDKKIILDEDGIIEILSQELKKRNDSLADYEKSNRQDLIDTLKEEMEVLYRYLPVQMTDAEVLEIVRTAAAEIGATSPSDMGKLMQAVMPKVKGRADGRKVNQAVKQILN